MHSHPFNAMSPCICNARCHCMSCHMHNECYMDNTIHTTYRCHGQSHHLHMTSINHFIHINLSCKHISTFTFNMSSYDQTMTHTSNPSIQEYRVFHPRGYLSLLVIPNTRIFHFLFLLCDRETHFGRCPIYRAHPMKHQT